MIQEKQIELIYVCTRCLRQHKTAAAAAGCCSDCRKVFLFHEKNLVETYCTKPALDDKQAKTGIWSANYDSKETD